MYLLVIIHIMRVKVLDAVIKKMLKWHYHLAINYCVVTGLTHILAALITIGNF